MTLTHGLTVLSNSAKGMLYFAIDWLGGKASGGLPIEALHPYGMRSRPRDPDTNAEGNPTDGAGLLLIERGGGDDGGIPTQDPRVVLVDEGKGGCQIYGWTGTAVATIVIDGTTGGIKITPAAGASITLDGMSLVGGAGGVAIARAPELQTWAAQVDAALATITTAGAAGLLGSPITIPPVTPLAPTVAAQKGTVV